MTMDLHQATAKVDEFSRLYNLAIDERNIACAGLRLVAKFLDTLPASQERNELMDAVLTACRPEIVRFQRWKREQFEYESKRWERLQLLLESQKLTNAPGFLSLINSRARVASEVVDMQKGKELS